MRSWSSPSSRSPPAICPRTSSPTGSGSTPRRTERQQRARLLRFLAPHAVSDRGVAGLLEVLDAHALERGVDVDVANAGHRAELLQHEEDHPVMDHPDPVAAADQVALLVAEVGRGERALLVLTECLAHRRIGQRMKEVVDPEALDRTFDGERIGAFELLGPLVVPLGAFA